MVSMPSPAAITCRRPEANGMAEQVAHRLARRFDRRLVGAVRGEPGAMRAGDLAARSVTAAIIAGQVSVGPSSGR
jgi:hypothetical protein